MGRRGIYRVLGGKPEGTRPLGRSRHRWENNIKADVQEVRFGGMDWIELAQSRECGDKPLGFIIYPFLYI
jgi:hypothetical protein